MTDTERTSLLAREFGSSFYKMSVKKTQKIPVFTIPAFLIPKWQL